MAIGKTDAEGRFELTTHFAGQASAKGAVPGDYEVTISKPVPPPGITAQKYAEMVEAARKAGEIGAMLPPGQQPPPTVELFAPHYSAPGKSRLKATVGPTGATPAEFVLN